MPRPPLDNLQPDDDPMVVGANFDLGLPLDDDLAQEEIATKRGSQAYRVCTRFDLVALGFIAGLAMGWDV